MNIVKSWKLLGLVKEADTERQAEEKEVRVELYEDGDLVLEQGDPLGSWEDAPNVVCIDPSDLDALRQIIKEVMP